MRFRFHTLRAKLSVLYAGLFMLVMAALAVVAQILIANNAASAVRRELAASSSVFDRIWTLRASALGDSADVLARDFGFRSAVATGDVPTIESALANLRARARVATVFIAMQDGRVIGDGSAALRGLSRDISFAHGRNRRRGRRRPRRAGGADGGGAGARAHPGRLRRVCHPDRRGRSARARTALGDPAQRERGASRCGGALVDRRARRERSDGGDQPVRRNGTHAGPPRPARASAGRRGQHRAGQAPRRNRPRAGGGAAAALSDGQGAWRRSAACNSASSAPACSACCSCCSAA